jgi:hypothetical protein
VIASRPSFSTKVDRRPRRTKADARSERFARRLDAHAKYNADAASTQATKGNKVLHTLPDNPDALLTRAQTASAPTECGFPVKTATLATKASRGGGPPYALFGARPFCRWADSLDWAKSRLSLPRTNSSEHSLHGDSERSECFVKKVVSAPGLPKIPNDQFERAVAEAKRRSVKAASRFRGGVRTTGRRRAMTGLSLYEADSDAAVEDQ